MDSLAPAPSDGAVTRSGIAPAATSPWFLAHYAAGAYVSPLGIGAGGAVSLSRTLNLRVGTNFFHYTLDGTRDGIPYTGKLHLGSTQATVDWFPFHGAFHLSPGVLFRNNASLLATVAIAPGQSFTLNGDTFYSAPTDPVHGSAAANYGRTGPLLTVGVGNWIPRMRHKHLTFPFEAGAAYFGHPKVNVVALGAACVQSGALYCAAVDSFPQFQGDLNAEVAKAQRDLNALRFYPVVSGGVSFKF